MAEDHDGDDPARELADAGRLEGEVLGPHRDIAAGAVVEEVHVAHELRDEPVLRAVVHLGGRVGLLELPPAHDHDPVGDRHRFLLVVGDEEDGDLQLHLDALQLLAHLYADLRVERGERLVHQQYLGLEDQGPGDGHALLLAAGELARVLLLVAVQREEGEEFRDLFLDGPVRDLAEPQPEGEVLEHGHVRPEVVALEHHGRRPLLGRQLRDVLPAQDHLPPVRVQESAHGAEDGGLAAARRPQEGDELGLGHLEVDVADPFPVAVQFRESHQLQLRIVRHRALLAYFILKPAARASAPANFRKTVRSTMVGSTRMTAKTAPAVDG
jgi:hypothetical protein